MTPLETLVLVLGIPFFFIEISQLIQLVRSQRKLTSIWEKVLQDPEYAGEVVSNALFGFIKQLSQDEEKQKDFFTFINICGQNAILGAKGIAEKAGVKMPKIKSLGDLLGAVIQMPQIQEKIANTVLNTAEKKVSAGLVDW